MVNNTQAQCDSPPVGGSTCGCAFGCHETNPAGESRCNSITCSLSGTGSPNGEDNYALARAPGVTLRIDLLNRAAQNLMGTAQTTEQGSNASYRAAIYTFDYQANTLQALTANPTEAQASAANLSMLEAYSNNWLTSEDHQHHHVRSRQRDQQRG